MYVFTHHFLLSSFIKKIKAKWSTSAPITHQLSTHKRGHLYLRRKKALGNPWKRVFARIHHGTFSFECPGRARGTLEFGDPLTLMLSDIRPVDQNERRFCFEIYSGSLQVVLQAESEDEMMDWVNTFHTAKTELLDQRTSPEGKVVGADVEVNVKVKVNESNSVTAAAAAAAVAAE
jgi:hypothetical protein